MSQDWERELVEIAGTPKHTLEQLLTDPGLFALPASRTQRALCRILSGLPAGDLEAEAASLLGGAPRPTAPPKETLLLAAIRCGKSLISAVAGVEAALYCDLGDLSRRDTAQFSIVSVKLANAKETRRHLVGGVMGSPWLRSRVVGVPTADGITLRNVSGHAVEIKIVAGARAGTGLVSRWSAGVIFDEAARMVGEEGGVVNLDHARRAVRHRLRPGARLMYATSPWAAEGPVWRWFTERFGLAPQAGGPIVLRATGPEMRPDWWTPERCHEAQLADEVSYRTDVLCEFAASSDDALLGPEEIGRAQRKAPADLPPVQHADYLATMDPAMRRNAWTLTVLTREGDRLRVVLVRQWVPGTTPLDPAKVLGELSAAIRPYGITTVYSDQWSSDTLASLAIAAGLHIDVVHRSADEISMDYRTLAERIRTRVLELPPDPQLAEDLGHMRRRVIQTGGTRVYLATTGSGRHADYAAALGLAMRLPLADLTPPPPEPDPMEAELLRQHAEGARLSRELGLPGSGAEW